MNIINFKKKKENEILNEMDIEFDSLEDPKWFQIFLKLAISFGLVNIGASIIGIFHLPIAITYIISTILFGPAAYVGIGKIKDKMDENFNRDMQGINQVRKFLMECSEVDHKIDLTTVCFYYEMERNEYIASLSGDTKTNINQFLYMINANYSEEIMSKCPSLNREDLFERIITEIGLVLSNNNITIFTLTEAKQVIDACFFISEDVRVKILKEFKKSEWNDNGEARYHIYDKNLEGKTFNEVENAINEELGSIEHILKTFDVNEISSYEYLLKCFGRVDESLKKYGEVTSVEWDLYAVRDVMAYMLNNYKKDIEESQGSVYNAKVVIDFMYNAFVYAAINNRRKVGIDEIIGSFKNWNYLAYDFNLKLELLDGIFERFNIDSSKHPYHKTGKSKKNSSRIITFPKKQI